MNKVEFEEKLISENLYVINCNGTEKRYNPNLFATNEVEKNSFGCLHIKDKWYCYVTDTNGDIRCEKNFDCESKAYDYLINYARTKAIEYKNSEENVVIKNIMNKLCCTEEQAKLLYLKTLGNK